MNRYWSEKLWTAITGTATSNVFTSEWFGKLQLFIKAASGTTWTYKIQLSPNKTDWFTLGTWTVTLVWTETGEALLTLASIWTATPYVRVLADTLSAGSIDIWIAFNENN